MSRARGVEIIMRRRWRHASRHSATLYVQVRRVASAHVYGIRVHVTPRSACAWLPCVCIACSAPALSPTHTVCARGARAARGRASMPAQAVQLYSIRRPACPVCVHVGVYHSPPASLVQSARNAAGNRPRPWKGKAQSSPRRCSDVTSIRNAAPAAVQPYSCTRCSSASQEPRRVFLHLRSARTDAHNIIMCRVHMYNRYAWSAWGGKC